METKTGSYYNLRSESGYDNYGLKVKFDIMIIFPEGFELDGPVIDSIDFMLEGRLRGLAMENPYAKRAEVDACVKQVLKALDYEYEIVLIKQGITAAGLVKDDYRKTCQSPDMAA